MGNMCRRRKSSLLVWNKKKMEESSPFLEENLKLVEDCCSRYCERMRTNFFTSVSLRERTAVVEVELRSSCLAAEEWKLLREAEPHLCKISFCGETGHTALLHVKFFK